MEQAAAGRRRKRGRPHQRHSHHDQEEEEEQEQEEQVALDELSLAGLISDDSDTAEAAAPAHQFYQEVDRAREAAASLAGRAASGAPGPSGAAGQTQHSAAVAAAAGSRRKRSRPQRAAGHSDRPPTAAEVEPSGVADSPPSFAEERPRSQRRRTAAAAGTGSALQDAIIAAQTRERAAAAAAQQATRRRGQRRAEKAAEAAAELAALEQTHIVLVASHPTEACLDGAHSASCLELALLSGSFSYATLRRVFRSAVGLEQASLQLHLTRVRRDAPCDTPSSAGVPQVHTQIDEIPQDVLTALLSLQQAGWVSMKNLTSLPSTGGSGKVGEEAVKMSAAICFTRLAFEDTAPHPPLPQEPGWQRDRRALARQVKQLMMWARPEQFQPLRLQDTSSSSSDEDAESGQSESVAAKDMRAGRPRFDARSLFAKLSAVHRAGAGRTWPERPDHALLRSQLRHYQRAAAEWMIEREQVLAEEAPASKLHPLWSPVYLQTARTLGPRGSNEPAFYYQLSEGRLARSCPLDTAGHGSVVAGGILADEMGLGKTVELLYCVLHNPKPLTHQLSVAPGSASASTITDQRPAELTVSGQCDDTEQLVLMGNWWHRRNSEADLSNAAYQKRCSAGSNVTDWIPVTEAMDLGDDLPLYLDKEGAAAYSGGDASKVPLLTLITLLLDALENVRDADAPWRVRSEVFMELPDRKKFRHYYATIAQPISFSCMRQCVSARSYKTVEQFQQDVRLMVSNAHQYNDATSVIFKDAAAIEASLAHLCRCCSYCRHIPPPGQAYTKKLTAPVKDSDLSDGQAETGSDCDSLCAAHWAMLGATGKSKYSLDLRNDGLHMKLVCKCCTLEHDMPVSELPDDGEDMDVIEWYCAQCEADIFAPTQGIAGELIDSSATLIVCPSAICQQWVNEISKHVASDEFRVHVYNGLRSGERTTAKQLATQHIVITTYDVLRQDVYHSAAYQADGQHRVQRYRKKHRVVPTPLTALRWWRVCLDEAQMVETTTAKAAEMAAQLPTVHRWCVTGTPIAHDLDDLYGLLVFLQAEPLDNRKLWLNSIKKPCELLVPAAVEQYHEFFCRIMWRSARTDVVDQLRLPPQHHHTELLEFSDIEAYYYERQHRECLTAANEVLRKYKDLPLNEPIVDKRWVQPFLRLRQACCHHQIGQASKAFLKGKSTAERPLTMAELTDRLLKKAKIEAEEAQRLMLMAINALAALVLLDNTNHEEDNRARATQLYRDVLQIADEHIERYHFKTDNLQRIHASINLSLLIHRNNPTESASLRESALKLRQDYSKLEHSDFKVAKLQLSAATEALAAVRPEQHFQPTVEPWWTRAASIVEEGGLGEEFVDRLRRELADKAGSSSREVSHSMLQFRDLNGLIYVLRGQLADTWAARNQVEAQVRALSEQMSDEDARVAGNCKECRPWGKGPVCAHCKLEQSAIIGYELRLYILDRDARGATQAEETDLAIPGGVAGPMNPQMARLAWNMKDYSKKNTSLKVSRSPAEPEIALTQLLRFLSSGTIRDHPDVGGLKEAGQAHLNAIGMMKKEFDKLRDVWLSQREVLYRTDELLMSEMRIRIRADGEEVPKEEEHFILQSMEEVRTRTAEFEAEKVAHMTAFQEAKASFSYVRNLKVQQDLALGDEAMQCPVCHEEMVKGSDIMITPCGHMYCYFCIMKVFERFTSDRISCPMCKKQVHKEDMNHVRERKAQPGTSAGRAALARSSAEASGSLADSAETSRPSTTLQPVDSSESAAETSASTSAAAANAACKPPVAAATRGGGGGKLASATATAAATFSEMRPEMAVKGDFGTKVDALVSHSRIPTPVPAARIGSLTHVPSVAVVS